MTAGCSALCPQTGRRGEEACRTQHSDRRLPDPHLTPPPPPPWPSRSARETPALNLEPRLDLLDGRQRRRQAEEPASAVPPASFDLENLQVVKPDVVVIFIDVI